jgi:toxin YoeB
VPPKRRDVPQPANELGERLAVFQPELREDLRWWTREQPRVADRIWALIEEIMRTPFTGMGKPEPLRYLGADVWSRRITQEHRLVYLVRHERIDFLQARYHYGDK